MECVAAVIVVHTLVGGLYLSGVATMSAAEMLAPELTITLPSPSVVPVAYQRGLCMGARFCHCSVFQSKAVTSGMPRPAEVDVPPITATRPSARTAWPAQKRSAAAFGICFCT